MTRTRPCRKESSLRWAASFLQTTNSRSCLLRLLPPFPPLSLSLFRACPQTAHNNRNGIGRSCARNRCCQFDSGSGILRAWLSAGSRFNRVPLFGKVNKGAKVAPASSSTKTSSSLRSSQRRDSTKNMTPTYRTRERRGPSAESASQESRSLLFIVFTSRSHPDEKSRISFRRSVFVGRSAAHLEFLESDPRQRRKQQERRQKHEIQRELFSIKRQSRRICARSRRRLFEAVSGRAQRPRAGLAAHAG